MIQFLLQHQFWAAVGIYWVFSAAVSSLPEPETKGSPFYMWFYRFLHTTAGNITTAFGGRIPGLRPLIPPALLLPVLLATPACAAHYTVHPGALNASDSAAYDTLLLAGATIQQAQAEFQAGKLSISKDDLNQLVALYNTARASWMTYRNAVAANAPSDMYFQQLNQSLLDLTNAIRNLTGKGVTS